VKLSDLRAKTKEVIADFGDGELVTMAVRVQAVTSHVMDELLELEQEVEASQAAKRVGSIISLVTRLVASWDILDEEGGSIIPVTAEALAEFPIPLLIALLQEAVKAAGESLALKPRPSEETSLATSQPTVN
jgi:hypothetical protein